MSTENVEVFNKYQGNGAATQFSIGFPYLKREYVKVYLYREASGKEVKLNSNQFSFVNDQTIKFPVLSSDDILQEGDILTIQRETTLGSEFEFDNQRRLFPIEVMNADDLSFQQIQELFREIKRTVRVTPTAKETPEELLAEVYGKLDSATEVAQEATDAANRAQQAVENAEKTLVEVTAYVDNAKDDINKTRDDAVNTVNQTSNSAVDTANNARDTAISVVTKTSNDAVAVVNATKEAGVSEINSAIDEARMDVDDVVNQAKNDLSSTIETAITEAKQEVVDEANRVISDVESDLRNNLQPLVDDAENSKNIALSSANEAKIAAEESKKYGGQIATTEEAIAGLNDTHLMTPLKTKQVISDNVGRAVQLGFNGYLQGNVLTFEPADGSVYDIRLGYEYELDLLFEAVGDVSDSVIMRIKNGSDIYNIVNAVDSDPSASVTIGSMKQIENYTSAIGFRWIFKVKYAVTSSGYKVLVMPSTVINPVFTEEITKRWENKLRDSAQNWQGTGVSFRTADGVVASIIESRNVSDSSTSNELRQYSATDMTKFAEIENKVKDNGESRLSYNSTGINTNLTEYSADSSNTDIALKGWVLKNSTNLEKSNCITEIPQDIKLELNNGTLTLKAGSKVYVPNGFEGTTPKFDEVTIIIDKQNTTQTSASGTGIVFYNTISNTMFFKWDNQVYSGTSDITNQTVYRTDLNKISESGAYGRSFPLGIITVTSGVITSIDQVFNGFGYIGNTLFALPNVKYLAPNGRNADGSLNNSSFTITSVITKTLTNTSDNVDFILQQNNMYNDDVKVVKSVGDINPSTTDDYYVTDTNQMIWASNGSLTVVKNRIVAGKISTSSGTITSFTPKTTFRAIDYSDKHKISGWGMPSGKHINLTLGASGSSYTAPANGWIAMRKAASNAKQFMVLYNKNTNIINNPQAADSGSTIDAIVDVKKGDVVKVDYTLGGITDYFRFIYAEGEN